MDGGPTYDADMWGILFWVIVIVVVLFFKLTTKAERTEMIVNFWIIIILMGAVGFVLQFLRQGTLSI